MLKMFLILAAISLFGCSKLQPFPKVSKWIIDTDNKLCIQCELIDGEKQLFKCKDPRVDKIDPIETCNGFFAQSPEDIIAEKNWILDTIETVKKNCGH